MSMMCPLVNIYRSVYKMISSYNFIIHFIFNCWSEMAIS